MANLEQILTKRKLDCAGTDGAITTADIKSAVSAWLYEKREDYATRGLMLSCRVIDDLTGDIPQ